MPGIIESAVQGHHPTPAVLFEAGALDRELSAADREWQALLRSIESFATHYPSVLLHSPDAIMTLGRACLEGIQDAPGLAMQKRFASLLVNLISGVIEEVRREGADRIPAEIPKGIETLLLEMVGTERVPAFHAHLLSDLLGVGKQIPGVGDSDNIEVWFALLVPLTRLLIRIVRRQLEGEPTYDGRWDGSDRAGDFQLELLEPVRQERVSTDLRWIGDKEKELVSGSSPAIDVFLEISAFSHRDQREAAWEDYFESMAASIQSGKLQGENLRQLCFGIAYWIEQASDRRLLARLAQILRSAAPAAAAANGRPGLLTVLDAFGKTVVDLLEKEAGRGEFDQALEDLRAMMAEVINRLLEVADPKVAVDTVQLGIRLRTGPLIGHPASLEDVVWRVGLAASHPDVADNLLLSLIAGFSLEDMLLRDDRQAVGGSLAGLLGRSWERSLLYLIRTVIRVAPLSPYHLGGPSTRAHLQALDPEDRKGSYLHDLKERVLSRAGRENLGWVENVMQFWRTGSPEYLDKLASPESLTTLPTRDKDEHLDHVHKLIQNLSRHAPVAAKGGIRWLARLPEAFYQADTLVKVAGFSGCSDKAVSLLYHLLNVYRALSAKYDQPDEPDPPSGQAPESILERCQRQLASREKLQQELFGEGGLQALSTTQRLEAFEHDLILMAEADYLLEDLANRGMRVLDRGQLARAVKILGLMISNTTLSGLGDMELVDLGRTLMVGQPGEQEQHKILGRTAWLLASTRNKLAERLQPHVEDSTRRLIDNPLARPALHYQGLFDTHSRRGVERTAVELGEVLIDDLLSADGGFLLLEDFVHRILHMLEQY